MRRMFILIGAFALVLGFVVPGAMAEVTHKSVGAFINFDGEATEFNVDIRVTITDEPEAGDYTVTITPRDGIGITFYETTRTRSIVAGDTATFTFDGNCTEEAEPGTYVFTYTVTGPSNYTEEGTFNVTLEALELPCFDAIYIPVLGFVMLGAVVILRKD